MNKSDLMQEVRQAAADTADNFLDEIAQYIVDDGKASDDLFNDYSNGDSYHHENHVDKWYGMVEAATIIEELADYEETDTGLWQGKDMADSLSACAAFTYGNAVMAEWQQLIKEINEEVEAFEWSYNDKEEMSVSEECKVRLKTFISSIIKRWP